MLLKFSSKVNTGLVLDPSYTTSSKEPLRIFKQKLTDSYATLNLQESSSSSTNEGKSLERHFKFGSPDRLKLPFEFLAKSKI